MNHEYICVYKILFVKQRSDFKFHATQDINKKNNYKSKIEENLIKLINDQTV